MYFPDWFLCSILKKKGFSILTLFVRVVLLVINEWGRQCNSNPPSRQIVYAIRDKFEQQLSVMNALTSGHPITIATTSY